VTAYCSQVALSVWVYMLSQCTPQDSHPSARPGHRLSAVLNAALAGSCSCSACRVQGFWSWGFIKVQVVDVWCFESFTRGCSKLRIAHAGPSSQAVPPVRCEELLSREK